MRKTYIILAAVALSAAYIFIPFKTSKPKTEEVEDCNCNKKKDDEKA